MRSGHGVNTVGLKQGVRLRHIGHAVQEKGHQGAFALFGDLRVHGGKLGAVLGPVIRGHLHTQQKHFGALGLAGLHHGVQIGLRSAQGQSAQGVITAQFNDDGLGLVLRQ